MAKKSALGRHVTSFIEKYLVDELGSPATTVITYAIAIKLFLRFSSEHLKKHIDTIPLKAIDDKLVLSFLDHLEKDRANLPQSRNHRLAAICTFVRYLAREDLLMLGPCSRITAIRPKNVSHKVMPSLNKEEVEAFLSVIPRTHLLGLLLLGRLISVVGLRVLIPPIKANGLNQL